MKTIHETIEDSIGTELLAQRIAYDRVLDESLANSIGPYGASHCHDAMLCCQHRLRVALACSERLDVVDGVVVVVGGQAEEMARRLARFNQRSETVGVSLAAWYLQRMDG